tara:strand:+ start:7197 stop:8147 length:951 start_codon:yes stop_codon:yes gene_type:complete
MRDDLDVVFREVGLRDGLQIIKTFFPTDQKIAWVKAVAAAGVPIAQVTSFVPPKVLPQFTDAAEVCEAARKIDGLCVSVLVPNLKGAERAVASGAHELGFIASVSEGHSLANVRRTSEEAVQEFARIVEYRDSLPADKRFNLTAGLSTAFGCTIDGAVPPEAVMALSSKFVEAGADELVVSDTVGYANPVQVKSLIGEIVREFGSAVKILSHFHDTRGLGLANAYAAYEAGCRMFDASMAGLGGCPFAPLASGNIVMEDLVFMFEASGLRTGIDLEKLTDIRTIISNSLPDEPLHGFYAKAGAPKDFKQVAMPMTR